MQITVQMLDGSITPFKVRSSITIASLKAKFEPWQPMKGRALLHHDVQLDDRATLGSVPGIKNGTILRVDKRTSQVKNTSTGKKVVLSGPASLAEDEDVVESIETSGDDEETLRKNERPFRMSEASVEDFVHENGTDNPLQGKMRVPFETRDNPPNMTDTNLSNTTMALRVAKRGNPQPPTPHEQATAPEAQDMTHRHRPHPHSHAIFATAPPENPLRNRTASTPPFRTPELDSSFHQNLMDDLDATFLSGIAAAAAETESSPLHTTASPDQDNRTPRCDTCGRACGCGKGVVSLGGTFQRREAVPVHGSSSSSHLLVAERSRRTESSWTGM